MINSIGSMAAKLLRLWIQIPPYCAVPNLHHKAGATVGNMYGLTFNKNKLVARISEIVTVIQVGLGSVKMTDQ